MGPLHFVRTSRRLFHAPRSWVASLAGGRRGWRVPLNPHAPNRASPRLASPLTNRMQAVTRSSRGGFALGQGRPVPVAVNPAIRFLCRALRTMWRYVQCVVSCAAACPPFPQAACSGHRRALRAVAPYITHIVRIAWRRRLPGLPRPVAQPGAAKTPLSQAAPARQRAVNARCGLVAGSASVLAGTGSNTAERSFCRSWTLGSSPR